MSYCEQLFTKLRRAKLIEGVRGPGGVYRLGKPPDKISIAQIVFAVDDFSGGENTIQTDDQLTTNRLWEDLSFRLYEFLDEITLAEFEVSRFSVKQDSTSGQINRMFEPVTRFL